MRIAFDLSPASYRERRESASSKIGILSRWLFMVMLMVAVIGTIFVWWYSSHMEKQIEKIQIELERLVTSKVILLRKEMAQREAEIHRIHSILKILDQSLPVNRSLAELAVVLGETQVDRISLGSETVQIQGMVPDTSALSSLIDRLSSNSLYTAFKVVEHRMDSMKRVTFTLWGQRRESF